MVHNIKEKYSLVLIFTLLFLQIVFFSFYIHKTSSTHEWVLHTYQVLISLNKLETHVYKLSQYENIQDSSNKSLTANVIKSQVKELKQETKDNPRQQQHVTEIEGLLADSTSKTDFQMQNGMINSINAMKQEEYNLLSVRTQESNQTADTFFYFLITSFLCTNALIVAYAFMLASSRKKIREREARLNLAVRSTSDALWDWDPNSEHVFYSSRFTELLGYKPDEWTPSLIEFQKRLHPDDRKNVSKAFENHLHNHDPFEIEYRIQHKNGNYMWHHANGQAIWDKKQKPIRMSGFVSDITHKKEVERIKDEFVSTVSHELRTPLTSIRGSIGLLLSETEGPLTAEMKNFLEIAYANSERLIFLINDILDIDKIESNKLRFDLKPESIGSLIKNSIELNKPYSDKYHVNFNIVEPLIDVQVLVDRDRFIQVMTNLLSNAAKFSNPNQNIDIYTSNKNNMIRVSVKDYGAGISKENQGSLFSKFYQIHIPNQKQSEGTGLGLYICRQLIEKMGGKISFESSPNQGTTFYFDLPIYTKQTRDSKEKMDMAVGQRGKLLICEDDYEVAVYLQKIIGKLGLDSDVATSVSQALNSLNTNHYEGIILDLILPDQNGIDLVIQLRTNPNFHNLPIIIVSIKAIEQEKVYGNSLGLIDWLSKPVDANKLISAINKIASPNSKPNILYVEDDEGLVNIIGRSLQNVANVISATSIRKAKEVLGKNKVDLILLDLSLPDGNGFEIINYLDDDNKVPVIVLSANEAPESISAKVATTFVKSCTSEATIINTIKQMIQPNIQEG